MRLKRRGLIRAMFDRSGDDVRVLSRGSVRVLYRFIGESEVGRNVPLQVAFAGPRGESGVSRTAIRRRLRESFRLYASDLSDALRTSSQHLTLVLIGRTASKSTREDVSVLMGELIEKVLGRARQSHSIP